MWNFKLNYICYHLVFLVIIEKIRLSNGCNWGSIENWLESQTEPPLGNLACPNPSNALYNYL